MFGISFTLKDVVRSAWVFVFAAAAALTASQTSTKAGVIAAIAAGLVAVKNLLLADGTTIKG